MIEGPLASYVVPKVLAILNPTYEGALNEFGKDLKQYIQRKLGSIFKLQQLNDEPEIIIDAYREDQNFQEKYHKLLEECKRNQNLQEEFQRVIEEYQQRQNTNKVSNNNSNSSVGNINISNNQGNLNAGQQNVENQFFR
ncbi:MAG: hypothetical protein QNJ68_06095 [Microcoleaceae cyanobacterium MO_207.B10]|nr:hypothetical protein [Microcoleaceae cyanobacterium MO_207.B10]